MTSSAQAAPAGLVQAAALGYQRIEVPTPYPVGDVNAYLIASDPLVLIDCGPATALALGALEAGLARVGRVLGDVDTVVVTHHHPDHFGLAGEIHRRTGATISCFDGAVPILEHWNEWSAANELDIRDGLVRHGVPSDVAAALHDQALVVRHFAAPTPVHRRLQDGDHIEFADRTLAVMHRPGHSTSDLVLFEEATGVLLAGDHLLADVSSNAIVSKPLDPGAGSRARSLLDYRASLLRTQALDVSVTLPGHGDPVTEHRALIQERFDGQESRAERIADILSDGPSTAHAIAVSLWGDMAVIQAYPTLSEVLGHLDLLIDRGAAVEHRDAPLITFERT